MTDVTALDSRMMGAAIDEARIAFAHGEVPIGAVVACGDKIIGRGHNLTESLNDVTAHAEMIAITAAASALNGKFLDQCTLYVTVEPCLMCAGAIGWSRIGRIVFGCHDQKRGYSTFIAPDAPRGPFHPRATVCSGVRAEECTQLMQDFFKKKR